MLVGNSLPAQELLQYSQKEEYLLVFPDGQIFGQEVWPVNFQKGTNHFLWQRTEGKEIENVSWKVQGGRLKSIAHELNSLTSHLSIEAEEERKGEIILLYPQKDIESQFIYQVIWEKKNARPQVLLWLTIKELGPYSPPRRQIKNTGKRVCFLTLSPTEKKRLLLASTIAEEAEKVIKYYSKEERGQTILENKITPSSFVSSQSRML